MLGRLLRHHDNILHTDESQVIPDHTRITAQGNALFVAKPSNAGLLAGGFIPELGALFTIEKNRPGGRRYLGCAC